MIGLSQHGKTFILIEDMIPVFQMISMCDDSLFTVQDNNDAEIWAIRAFRESKYE